VLQQLEQDIRAAFPYQYPEPPWIELSQSVFAALAQAYPLTVKYFQKIPNGAYGLSRVCWWEQRWPSGVRSPKQPKQVIFSNFHCSSQAHKPVYDLIYLEGALGFIHAVVIARWGYPRFTPRTSAVWPDEPGVEYLSPRVSKLN